MTEHEALKGRLEKSEKYLRDAAENSSVTVMGGSQRVWSLPEKIKEIADDIKDAREALDG